MNLSAQQYFIKSYSLKNGLSGDEVYGIFQDSRGYLWITTEGGLCRFDGKSFHNYSMADSLPGLSAFVLYEETNGNLWMSYVNGVCMFNGQTFKKYPIENETNRFYILKLQKNNSNKMQFTTGDGVWELRDSAWHKLHYFNDNVYHHFCYVEELSNGSKLINLYDSLLIWKNQSNYKTIYRIDAENPSFYNISVSQNHRYVSTWNHLYILENDSLIPVHDSILNHKRIRTAYQDSKGRLWVGTEGNGFYIFEQNTFIHYDNARDGYYGAASFLEDNEGNMWVGTLGKGLLKVKTSYVDFYDSIENKKIKFLAAACKTPSGNLLFSRRNNSIIEWNGKQLIDHKNIINFNTPKYSNAWIYQIIADTKNRIWMLSNQSQLFRHSNNKTEDLTAKFDIGFGSILTSYSKDSSMYLVDNSRIICIKNDDSFAIDSLKTEANEKITFIAVDSNNTIWKGNSQGTICKLNKNQNNLADEKIELGNCSISKIYFSNSKTLWVATVGKGIYRFIRKQNKWIENLHLANHNGLPGDIIKDITFDHKNKLWVTTPAGLAFVTLNNTDTGTFFNVTHLTSEEGFGLPDFYYPRLITSDIGDIWYCTNNYLACIHANSLMEDTIPPKIEIENVFLFNDDKQWTNYTNSFKGFFHLPVNPVLAYNQNNISILFNAITFSENTNLEYNYRLKKSENKWHSTLNNDLVTYENLRPGKYTFEVRAKKTASHWSYQYASFTFTILQPWYQTWWFYLLCFLLVIGIVYSFYRYRLQQALQLQNIRNKIAADLHDDIGSTLNSISVYSEVAKNNIEKKNEALDMIGDASRKIIEDMSDIVWTINPDNDSFENLIERMRSHTYNLLRSKSIDYTFKADEDLNELSFSVERRRNFFLIFKEAINNMIKYADASRASIIIKKENNVVKMMISDNGKGFNYHSFKEGKVEAGNGLNNMKKRAAEMHAEFFIESASGSGTQIVLKLKT